MDKALARWCRVCGLCSFLLLGACSGTTFVYNRLDFLVPWYVDDYVDLNPQQKQYLTGLVAPFLAWHRSQELPDYLTILDGIQDSLNKPQTPVLVAAVFKELESAWLRIEDKGLDWLLDLGAQLSDAQIANLLEKLWERQDEFKAEYLERTDEEFYEDSYDESVDSAREYMGPLSGQQRELLRTFSRSLLRSDQAWLEERAQWLTELAVLLERKPGWQQRIREAVAARRKNVAPEHQRIYDHNLEAIYSVIAQLLNGRSEQQDRHLRDRVSALREDLQSLIAEGQGGPASAKEPKSETPATSPAG